MNGYSRTISRNGLWQAGDVIRRNGREADYMPQPFSDTVILGFSDEGVVRVSRPYVFAMSVGTSGPVPLLGCETYEFPEAQLDDKFFQSSISLWRKIDDGRVL